MSTIIEDKRKGFKVKFDDIYEGDLFDFEGEIWIRTETIINLDGTVMGNAVGLNNGLIETFLPEQYVVPIKRVVVIE